MSMRVIERAFLGSILNNLGVTNISEDEINAAVKQAFADVKREQGLNPDETKLHLELVPISRQWVDGTFDGR